MDAVVALNVAEVAPAATITDAGTVSGARLLDRATVVAAAAAEARVTVQWLDALLDSVEGVQTRDVSCPVTLKFSVALCVIPFKVALIVADPLTTTDPTVKVKVAELCPAPMPTDAGADTFTLLLAIATLTALAAGAERTIVQLDVPGAFRDGGTQEIPASCATGARLMDADTVAPFQLARTEAVAPDDNAPVAAANVEDDCPAAIVTLDGTASDVLLLLRAMVAALAAALLRDTVHVAAALAPSVDGLQDTDVNTAGAL